jgi:hypothetical protein
MNGNTPEQASAAGAPGLVSNAGAPAALPAVTETATSGAPIVTTKAALA